MKIAETARPVIFFFFYLKRIEVKDVELLTHACALFVFVHYDEPFNE